MNLDSIRALIANDLAAVDQLIQDRLRSDVALINQLGHYIIAGGGKRLRPVLALLAAGACGYRGVNHHLLAVIVEFIHTATLLHDDVVDASELRRGRETANAVWGNEASVLVGDFLYSRAFQLMVEVENMRIMAVLADATNTIAEGEVLQLLNCNNADATEEEYLHVIRSKTAKLFEAACRVGAIVADRPQNEIDALAVYGMHLGTAFQLIDDVLDYTGATGKTGKNVGDDLAEGKPTLPLIFGMRRGTPEQTAIIRQSIENGGRDHIDAVMATIETTGALDYTRDAARKESDLAINALVTLQASEYKTALISLAKFAVDRDY